MSTGDPRVPDAEGALDPDSTDIDGEDHGHADDVDGVEGDGAEELAEQPSATDNTFEAEDLRDGELAALRDAYTRLAADFDNFRKRTARTHADEVDRAAGTIVEGLLPVLDACDAALAHGAEEIRPIADALLGALEKEGLVRLAPEGDVFDPTRHEAVISEESSDGDGVPTVTEVIRTGYVWRDKVLRPAMVKVRA